MDKIERAKKQFLNEYNPKQCNVVALSEAIGAAVGRNKLYMPLVKYKDTMIFRKEWEECLIKIGNKYIHNGYTESDYLDEIVRLRTEMNNKFHKLFTTKADVKEGFDPGFRLSHSQKSISVYLKHLWCLGENKTPPPQCPIDRKILSLVIIKGKIPAWTKVNSLKYHNELMQLIKNQAENNKYDLVSEWELVHYLKSQNE